MKIQGRIVLITGAARGIGRLLALGAATRGAAGVVLWDRDPGELEAVAEQVRRLGSPALTGRVDVTDEDAVAEAAAQAEERFGGVDILVNNAGIVTGKRFVETSGEEVRRTYEVNSIALHTTTRYVLPGMLRRDRGLVVNIASAAGLVGVARQTDYSASKFAAVGFTESLRNELRAEGSRVRTLVVCPYYIDTGMFAGVTTRFPLLLPIQQPRAVAIQILKAIERGKARLVTPPFATTTFATRMLPVPVAERILDTFGINQGMDHFRGHGPQR